eukprot:2624424-Rhodomonas_salina.1
MLPGAKRDAAHAVADLDRGHGHLVRVSVHRHGQRDAAHLEQHLQHPALLPQTTQRSSSRTCSSSARRAILSSCPLVILVSCHPVI